MHNKNTPGKPLVFLVLVLAFSMSVLLPHPPAFGSDLNLPPDTLPADPRNATVPREAQGAGFTLSMFPVVISMAEHPSIYAQLSGLTSRHVRVAHYNSGAWHPVPFQIDEVGTPYVWYDENDPTTPPNPELRQTTLYVPYGDPYGHAYEEDPGKIDANDELVFYAYNGVQAPHTTWWNASYPQRVELAIQDASTGTTSYIYVYYCRERAYEAIETCLWYVDYVDWDPANFHVTTSVYQLGFQPTNFDLVDQVSITGAGNDGANLVSAFKKSYTWSRMKGAIDPEKFFGTSNEGSWPTGDGFANPGDNSLKETAFDDPGDAYDANEGPLQNAPGVTNDITGAGDHRAIIDGPVRVVLGRHSYEYTDTGKIMGVAAELHTQSFVQTKFYHNMMEEYAAPVDVDPIGVWATMTIYYSFMDVMEFSPTLRNDLTIKFGAETTNPNYGNFPGGVKLGYPDGSPTNDGYSHGGDPTCRTALNLPTNPDIPDWYFAASETHGGLWRYVGREEADVENIDENNFYWHDAAISEMGYETEFGVIEGTGIHVPSFWVRTIFGDYSDTTATTTRGNLFYDLFKGTAGGLIDVTTYSMQTNPNPLQVKQVFSPSTQLMPGDTGTSISVLVENAGPHHVQLNALTLSFTAGTSDVGGEYSLTGPAPSLPLSISAFTSIELVFSSDLADPATLGLVTIDATTTGTDPSFSMAIADNDGADQPHQWNVAGSAPPQVSSPPDLVVLLGTSGNTLSWQLSDDDPATYDLVLLNPLTSLASGASWIDGQLVQWNIDNLTIGNYQYQLRVRDSTGNIVTDLVSVEVVDSTLAMTNQTSKTILAGNDSEYIEWTGATTLVPDQFVITSNGTPIVQGPWIPGISMNFSLAGLQPGFYMFACQINTTTSEQVNDTAEVTIVNNPPVLSTHNDLSFVEGQRGYSMRWIVTDDSVGASQYVVYQNASRAYAGNWSSHVPIVHGLDGLSSGEYHVRIEVSDGFGSSARDEFLLWITISNQTRTGTTGQRGTQNSTGITQLSPTTLSITIGVITGGSLVTILAGLYLRHRKYRYRL